MGSTWRLLLAPLIVLVLAVVALWLHRRRGALGGGRRPLAPPQLEVVDTLALGQNCRLLVVEWSGSRLLLAHTAHGVALIERRSPAAEDTP